jgi:hypothetical protein
MNLTAGGFAALFGEKAGLFRKLSIIISGGIAALRFKAGR